MHSEMGRAEKIANLGAVVFPFVATIAAAALFWNRLVSPADLIVAATMYLLDRCRDNCRLPPLAHSPFLSDRETCGVPVRRSGIDGGTGAR